MQKVREENGQLRLQIVELEEKLVQLLHCNSAGDMEKKQMLITYLEQQVTLQQREWDLQKKVISKEKCRAVEAAKFATQKLLETVKDFQDQVVTQKRVQLMLTDMLHQKEEQLKNVTSKVKHCLLICDMK